MFDCSLVNAFPKRGQMSTITQSLPRFDPALFGNVRATKARFLNAQVPKSTAEKNVHRQKHY